MQALFDEFFGPSSDFHDLPRIVLRLVVAAVVGGAIGIQRQLTGKSAGLRTHMLIAMGTTLFVLSSTAFGMQADVVARIIQGIATGVGFLGAGAILKLPQDLEIFGLTTAAGIWMTAAAGVNVGIGHYWSAVLAVICAWLVLAALVPLERRLHAPHHDHG
jgi:putative Mg2+ transporter-C (MgtC) family protein